MCLVIAIFLIVFGYEFYDTNFLVSMFSFGLGSIMFGIFLYRLSTYKKRKKLSRGEKRFEKNSISSS